MKKSYFKVLSILFVIVLMLVVVGCGEKVPPGPEPHDCVAGEWVDAEERVCGKRILQEKYCTICNEFMDERYITVQHEYITETVEATCTEDGYTIESCANCDKEPYTTKLYATGHVRTEFRITEEAKKDGIGKKELYCKDCNTVIKETSYANNGFKAHGKLSVNEADLVDENGDKFQLQGLSTHGLQWAGYFLNDRTIEEIVNEFGINLLRIAVYTDENGYAYGNDAVREKFDDYVREAVRITYRLGIYLIVDWHMVGAQHEEDKNPLTHLELAKDFFSRMSKEFADYDHILYEIMNEPNGSTTWADCKAYAEQIIPCIRENSDAIILVGNPKWTADLNSVMADPLRGYTNLMYTYHFYAADHGNTSQVRTAYDRGFPVFISEYGFMNSDGDGDINPTAGQSWMKVLNDRNISYCAWNISNTKGSASIFVHGTDDIYDVSDSNLKVWGQYLKAMYRKNAGLK